MHLPRLADRYGLAVSLAAAAALPVASLALASRLREPRCTEPRAPVTA